MAGVNQSTVKTVSIHQSKSDVGKFDGTKIGRAREILESSELIVVKI